MTKGLTLWHTNENQTLYVSTMPQRGLSMPWIKWHMCLQPKGSQNDGPWTFFQRDRPQYHCCTCSLDEEVSRSQPGEKGFQAAVHHHYCRRPVSGQRRLQLKTLAKPLRLTMGLFVQHIQQKTTCEGRTGGRRKRLAATSRPAAASGAKRSAASTRKSSGTISRKSITSQSPKNQRNPQGRCCFCHWKDDRKTTCYCVSCRNWLCREHAAHVCPDCTSLLQTEVTIVYRHSDELPSSH